MIPSRTNKPRLSHKDTAATLGFQSVWEFQQFRLRCQRDGVALPPIAPGGFLMCDIPALKEALAASSTTAQADTTTPSPRDRRSHIDRRKS